MLIELYGHENPFLRTANLDYRIVRGGHYKHFRWIRFDDGTELYDLEADPCELRNLAGDPEMSELVTELDAELRRLVRESLVLAH